MENRTRTKNNHARRKPAIAALRTPPVVQALAVAGGSSARLADMLRAKCGVVITPQAISQWRKIPPGRVLAVARVTNIPPHVLRPDYYPACIQSSGHEQNTEAHSA